MGAENFMKHNLIKTLSLKILIICCFYILSINLSYADLFNYSINIMYESKDAKLAKDLALKYGRLLALKSVVKKIILYEDSKKVDTLLNIDNATKFDEGFSLKNENITSKFYVAYATYNFSEKKILNFLDDNNIPYVKNKLSKYVLIIKSTNLEANNLWEKYWDNLFPKDYLSTFIPYIINKSIQSNNINPTELLNQHNAKDIYELELIKNDILYQLNVKNLNTNKIITFKNINSIPLAVSNAQMFIENKEKKIFIKANSTINDIELIIDTTNFNDWVFIQNKLNKIENLKFILTEVGNDYVKIIINFKGNTDSLAHILTDYCIGFNINQDILFAIPNCNH